MTEQTIFLITPLGNNDGQARIHADRMRHRVFDTVEKHFESEGMNYKFVRADTTKEGTESRIRSIMDLIRNSRGCIVDLWDIKNLNVIYEVGLAHSQGKRVFFLRSDLIQENDIPSDIRYYADHYHSYNVERFEGETSADEINTIQKKVTEVVKAMILGSVNSNLYRPVFYEPTKDYVSNVLEKIDDKITNLENLIKEFGSSSEDERTLAQYIIGEDEAFNALTAAVQKSNISTKTTRFSPYSVVGRQNTFFNAINNLMSRNIHPESFERIITANNTEKFNEVQKLMANNTGKNFKIYISKIEYSFEMVVVDDEIVFIHFRKYNHTTTKQMNSDVSLITATLRIEKRLIANEFSTIFDSIKNNSKDIICVIDCNKINTENLGSEIDKYKFLFNEAVNEYVNTLNKEDTRNKGQ